MTRTIIQTDQSPSAIGTYSQAVNADGVVYISGQIPLDPDTMEIVDGDFRAKTEQVFENLKGIANAAGGSFKDIAKVTIFLTNLDNFAIVNEVMATHFEEPYPARAAIGVASLPKDVAVEVEGVMYLG